MSRSMASLFVNCDRCELETEVILDWEVIDTEDICSHCLNRIGKEENDNSPNESNGPPGSP